MTPFNSHLMFSPAHVCVSGALRVLMRTTPSPTTAFGCLCLNNNPTKTQKGATSCSLQTEKLQTPTTSQPGSCQKLRVTKNTQLTLSTVFALPHSMHPSTNAPHGTASLPAGPGRAAHGAVG